jgi:hypothetical protein
MGAYWLTVSVLSVSLAIVGLVVGVHYRSIYHTPPNAYAVVADAGSSKTDVRRTVVISTFNRRISLIFFIFLIRSQFTVYTWVPPKWGENSVAQIVPMFSPTNYSCSVSGGIANLWRDPESVCPCPI